MFTEPELRHFLDDGYLHVPGLLNGAEVEQYRQAFETTWHSVPGGKLNQHVLLKRREWIELIEHPPILDRHRAVFGEQVQLLQYDLLRQGPGSTMPIRSWHRDFVFPGDHPLSINTIVYLDEMTDERGPTYVVPGSHRGQALPPTDQLHVPLPGEVPVYAQPGDAVFINSAIWHSGGRNTTEGLRRAIYLYYGHWWLKRYEADQTLPWQALENAGEQRLRLLGVKMPDRDIHQYRPHLLPEITPSEAQGQPA